MKDSDPAPIPLRGTSDETVRAIEAHPGLAIAGVYLILTLIGLMYQAWLFSEFHLNVLEFLETGDFLMAAIRQALVVAQIVIPLALALLVLRGVDRLRRRSRPAALGKLWVVAVVTLLYGALFTRVTAEHAADEIRAGHGRRITADLHDAAARAGVPSEALLIGATTRFAMLYDPADSLTWIVPVENLSKLTVSSGRTLHAPARGETAPPLIPQK